MRLHSSLPKFLYAVLFATLAGCAGYTGSGLKAGASQADTRAVMGQPFAVHKAPAGAAGPSIPQAVAARAAHRFGLSLEAASGAASVASAAADGVAPASERGARVAEVAENSAASEAGLVVGDVILMANHAPVTNATEIMRALHASRASGREFAPLLVQSPDGAIRFVAMRSSVSE